MDFIKVMQEHLDLINKGAKNLPQVIEGVTNSVIDHTVGLEEEKKAVIEKRRAICEACPFMSENAKLNGYSTTKVFKHCSLCGCSIEFKTASLESDCGALWYNQELQKGVYEPSQLKPVLWYAYSK